MQGFTILPAHIGLQMSVTYTLFSDDQESGLNGGQRLHYGSVGLSR
jgi:hypothetical protein